MPSFPPRGASIRVACILLAFGAPGCGLRSLAFGSIGDPSGENAEAIVPLVAGKLSTTVPVWGQQRAPGFLAMATSDARPVAALLDGWVKIPVDVKTGEARASSAVSLPESWPRQRPYERAWYVAQFDLGTKLPETLWLRFEAVAHVCALFVNGRPVGRHLGGYTPFEFELTSAVRPGANTFALWIEDETGVTSGRSVVSMVGLDRPGTHISVAGIRGGIFLEARPAVQVGHVLVETSTRESQIRIKTSVRSSLATAADAQITQAVYAWPAGGAPVLILPNTRAAVAAGTETWVENVMPWRDAERWSPEHPHLYTLRTTVTAGGRGETYETRFGFREFWTEGKNFMLNGQPIRLRGASDGRDFRFSERTYGRDGGRDFYREVFGFLKREFNYNAIRFHAAIYPPAAAQAADETGCLVINQSALWSAMGTAYDAGAGKLLANTGPQFAEWFWRDANNASIAIWDVENELIRGEHGAERVKWVLALDRFIKQLDPTRIVEHSGAGWYSPSQETIHVHMQEQYNRVLEQWTHEGRHPIIFGEFWIGGRGETRLPSSLEFAGNEDWHREEARIYREQLLEMRAYGASGMMPFRLHVAAFDEPVRPRDGSAPKFNWRYPDVRNFGASGLAPVVAFAWPRATTAVEDAPLEKEIVVCNDLEEPVTLAVTCDYAGLRKQWSVHLRPAEQQRHPVSFASATGTSALVVTVTDEHGHAHAGDRLEIHTLARAMVQPPALQRRLIVVPPPTPETAEALHAMGLRYESAAKLPVDSIAATTLVMIPPDVDRDALGRNSVAVRRYLAAGGRVLCLAQSEAPAWLPVGLAFWSGEKETANEFIQLGWPAATKDLIYSRYLPLYAEGHPVFAGLVPGDLDCWNARDGRVSDDAFVRPSALGLHAGGAYRVLAGATRRENASLIELREGAGTAVLCQAQIFALRAHPAAPALLMNLLRYLDGPAWSAPIAHVGLAGDLLPTRLAALTGLAPEVFLPVTEPGAAPDFVLAGDHADVALLHALAVAGKTVLVLSRETAARLPGYAVGSEAGKIYVGTRAHIAAEPLFWGVATGSFLPIGQSPARGALIKIPAGAQTTLAGLVGDVDGIGQSRDLGVGGLESMEGAAPVAVVEPLGRGRLVVTTLEPWENSSETHRQLLAALLANAGLGLPNQDRPAVIAVKRTVPLKLDGKLDDWTNDMEDRNVSRFRHAEPIAITSRDAISGKIADDLEQSAVVYLLCDDAQIFFGGIAFARDANLQVDLQLDDHRITLDLGAETVAVDGHPAAGARIAGGRQTAGSVADTRLLSLLAVDRRVGNLETKTSVTGHTFEAAIPWAALGRSTLPSEARGSLRLIRREGAVLQVPEVEESGAATTLLLRFEAR
jgi:hypothetical protein